MQKLLSAPNLAAALRDYYANVSVHVIEQKFACATAQEQELLQINETHSWIREVYLQGDGINVIHARVVVPYATYKEFQTVFDTLGNKFLGESFLYQTPHQRSPFIYTTAHNKCQRHSIFYIHTHKLLIIELFL